MIYDSFPKQEDSKCLATEETVFSSLILNIYTTEINFLSHPVLEYSSEEHHIK